MNINMSSIMGKVHRYADSDEGQNAMRGYIIQIMSRPYDKKFALTQAAGTIADADEMIWLANKLISCLYNTAKGYNLPPSVLKHFASLEYTKPYLVSMNKGIEYSSRIYFEDELSGLLSRKSLDPEEYGGVNNIIALFNNGYRAGGHVYGLWIPAPEDSEGYDGESTNEKISSKLYREGLQFIQHAIEDFNGNFGYYYGATAYLPTDSDYTDNSKY